MAEILDGVEGPLGYWLGAGFNKEEVTQLCSFVEEGFLRNIERVAQSELGHFVKSGLGNYHTQSHRLDHATAWPRHVRLLGNGGIGFVHESGLFKRLCHEFGKPIISNEIESNEPEIVWRLVRPGEASDVGPLHADSWFWEINGWPVPLGHRCVKVWVLLVGVEGCGGLRVVPGSHRDKNWDFGMENRNGMKKPTFDESEVDARAVNLGTRPGDAAVFSYDLLHGGFVSCGDQSRVSIEFTLFVPEGGNSGG
jgi:hypothetical protein